MRDETRKRLDRLARLAIHYSLSAVAEGLYWGAVALARGGEGVARLAIVICHKWWLGLDTAPTVKTPKVDRWVDMGRAVRVLRGDYEITRGTKVDAYSRIGDATLDHQGNRAIFTSEAEIRPDDKAKWTGVEESGARGFDCNDDCEHCGDSLSERAYYTVGFRKFCPQCYEVHLRTLENLEAKRQAEIRLREDVRSFDSPSPCAVCKRNLNGQWFWITNGKERWCEPCYEHGPAGDRRRERQESRDVAAGTGRPHGT